MSKLWRATVEVEIYLLGDTRDDARDAIPDCIEAFGDVMDSDWDIRPAKFVSAEWKDSLPFGERKNGSCKLTCQELLDLVDPVDEVGDRAQAEFNAHPTLPFTTA